MAFVDIPPPPYFPDVGAVLQGYAWECPACWGRGFRWLVEGERVETVVCRRCRGQGRVRVRLEGELCSTPRP